MTGWVVQAWRTAATTSGSSGTERSTPLISAPMVGEMGWTPMLVARVTRQLCTAGAPASIRPVPSPRLHCRAIDLHEHTKGSGMSDDIGAGEFVLTPPARNYSPWYQW